MWWSMTAESVCIVPASDTSWKLLFEGTTLYSDYNERSECCSTVGLRLYYNSLPAPVLVRL